MLRNRSVLFSVAGAVLLIFSSVSSSSTAFAQCGPGGCRYPGGCTTGACGSGNCTTGNCGVPYTTQSALPMQCSCVQPVIQTQYRDVPVTQYQQVKQVVQRPVCDVKYVDQPVTEYVPVTQQRTATVPQVTYRNVTEYKTVTRNCGYWKTEYRCVNKPSPCAYDCRPGLIGWANRTGYEMRSAFTPKYVAHRRYVPQVTRQVVPVTRQVPVTCNKQVTYNVTTMKPVTTTRKVAVRSIRYVNETVTAMKPVTVMRRVPVGTTVAYVNPTTTTACANGCVSPTASADNCASPTASAYDRDRRSAKSPSPDPLSNRQAEETKIPKRTANSKDNKNPEPFRRDTSDYRRQTPVNPVSRTRSLQRQPVRESVNPRTYSQSDSLQARQNHTTPSLIRTRKPISYAAPARTVASSNRWTSRRRQQQAPQLNPPNVSVADTNR